MVTKKEAASENPWAKLDDEEQYGVDLKRAIKVGRSIIRPGADVMLKGKIIKENANDIADIRPVTA